MGCSKTLGSMPFQKLLLDLPAGLGICSFRKNYFCQEIFLTTLNKDLWSSNLSNLNSMNFFFVWGILESAACSKFSESRKRFFQKVWDLIAKKKILTQKFESLCCNKMSFYRAKNSLQDRINFKKKILWIFKYCFEKICKNFCGTKHLQLFNLSHVWRLFSHFCREKFF